MLFFNSIQVDSVIKHTNKNNVNIKESLDALLGLHAFTGCDTVSAFAGHGKIRSMKLMAKTQENVKLFAELGKTFQLSEELVNNLQEFVCKMYGKQSRGHRSTAL
jgi:hypothetical protein